MRTTLAVLVLWASFIASAEAQVTQRCGGEAWAELASARFGRPELARVLALYNGADTETCTKGEFVRFPITTKHEMKLGQNLAAVLPRFCTAPGALELVLAHNQLPSGVEPAPGAVVLIPAELALAVGTRPEAELTEIPGLPALPTIRAYNGLASDAPLPAGGTIYVPLYLEAIAPTVIAKTISAGTSAPVGPTSTPTIASGPGPTFSRAPNAVVATFSGFRHAEHQSQLKAAYACGLCHLGDHGKPYAPVPEALCTSCHPSVKADGAARVAQLPLRFSHDGHLSPSGKPKEAGYEIDCALCHPANQMQEPVRTDHATCIRCHNLVEHRPAVDGDCTACHGAAEETGRLLLATALLAEHQELAAGGRVFRFTHGVHVSSLGGPAAATTETCDRCHVGTRRAKGLEELEPTRMADCLDCHRGLVDEAAESAHRLDRCATCHLEDQTRIAPRFTTIADRPTSHSPAFRAKHQAAAEADQGICQSCHLELGGGLGRECSSCHLKLRPKDHGARWREEPHGRAALRQGPDRCATCHSRDRCADCHAQAPRDHFPASSFRVRHGTSARVSMRRCQTCHLPQVDCVRCHDVSNL